MKSTKKVNLLLSLSFVLVLALAAVVAMPADVEAQAKASEACLSCHGKVKTQFQFKRSQHSLNDVNCMDCHESHDKKTTQSNKATLKMEEPELCYSCHEDVKLKFAQRNSHNLESGEMTCSSCHTPHGGPGGDVNASLKKHTPLAGRANDIPNETCVSCHAEKEGPFVNQHSSVVAEEGCASCHTPHGSQNRFMLKYQKTDTLCLSCHGEVKSWHYYDLDANPAVDSNAAFTTDFANCTNCHGTIHGSNEDFMMLEE